MVGKGDTTTLSASVLTYKDVQKYFKRLRIDGYEFRYMVSGEYGSRKGRAHWHMLMFWQNKIPPHEEIDGPCQGRTWNDKYWTKHKDSDGGHVHWQHFSYRAAKYVCKYLMKNESDEKAQSIIRWSRKPILGFQHLEWWAEEHIRQGLVPAKPLYWFPEVLNPTTKKPLEFWMSEAAQKYFCKYFIKRWIAEKGQHPLFSAYSKFIEEYEDDVAQRLTSEQLERRKFMRLPEFSCVDENGEIHPWEYDQKLNVYRTVDGHPRFYWSHDQWGNLKWTEEIKNAVKVGANSTAWTKKGSRKAGSVTPGWSETYRKQSNGE